MTGVFQLRNPVLEYAWGSHTAIAELLGEPAPSERPQAELWMGGHPKAPSMVQLPDREVPLDEFIRLDPAGVLGEDVADAHGPELPFLMKVLAAATPLSIQAHPDARQAREGFEAENALGIDPMAPDRNYRDPNHKPELICALTPFWAVNGFRPVSRMDGLLEQLGVEQDHPLRGALREGDEGIRLMFEMIMSTVPDRGSIIDTLVGLARDRIDEADEFSWMARLAERYPGDAGVICPVLLNLVCLEPGEAMYLPARRLHAYLDGTGIEIMANSDNVLRGGLTPKHVDVPELMRVLDFSPSEPGVTRGASGQDEVRFYPSPAREFLLSVITCTPGRPHVSSRSRSVQILLCTQGACRLSFRDDSDGMEVRGGTCLLVPADVPGYRIQGEATLFRASVPDPRLTPS